MEFKKFREQYSFETNREYITALYADIQSQFGKLYDHINCTFNRDELKSRKKNNIRQVGQQLINKFGAEHQIIIAIEELSELQKELCKLLRHEPNGSHLMEEIADVEIILEQLKLILRDHSDIDFWINQKLRRAKERYLDDKK